jgi:hypothetical protein
MTDSLSYVEAALQPLENIMLHTKGPTDSSKDVILKAEKINISIGFLDLQREIRDEIYNLLFLSDGPIYPSKSRADAVKYCLPSNKQNHIFRSCRSFIWQEHLPN